MEAIKRKQLLVLRAVIKGSANESRQIRKNLIHPKKGPEKATGWYYKRNVGAYARVFLLSYGLMRGFAIEQLEGGHTKTKRMSKSEALLLAPRILEVAKFYGPYQVKWCQELTENFVVSWLLGAPNTVFKYVKKAV